MPDWDALLGYILRYILSDSGIQHKALTVKEIAALIQEARTCWKAQDRLFGRHRECRLYLLVKFPTGKTFWRLKYTLNGRVRVCTSLGEYPTVSLKMS